MDVKLLTGQELLAEVTALWPERTWRIAGDDKNAVAVRSVTVDTSVVIIISRLHGHIACLVRHRGQHVVTQHGDSGKYPDVASAVAAAKDALEE